MLVATEEIFREPPPVAPSPPSALVQDPLLSVEDFAVEQADPAPSGTDPPLRQTTPAESSTQSLPGSRRFAPIVFDDGKQLPSMQNYSSIHLYHLVGTNLFMVCR